MLFASPPLVLLNYSSMRHRQIPTRREAQTMTVVPTIAANKLMPPRGYQRISCRWQPQQIYPAYSVPRTERGRQHRWSPAIESRAVHRRGLEHSLKMTKAPLHRTNIFNHVQRIFCPGVDGQLASPLCSFLHIPNSHERIRTNPIRLAHCGGDIFPCHEYSMHI